MKLKDLDFAPPSGDPWGGAYKIPWDDPEFSARMLREHLSQDHDMASRRAATIGRHVQWIHEHILAQRQSRLLDLACGPGFYAQRLADLGHSVCGIDFAPSSIEYARKHPPREGEAEYVLGDLRTTEFGAGYDAVLMIYGEFNAFSPVEVAMILRKASEALRDGGELLIEAHTPEQIERTGREENSWFHGESGLFSGDPHICLVANHWLEQQKVAVTDFYVIDPSTDTVTKYTNTLQGYSLDEYRRMLMKAGFEAVEILPPWDKSELTGDDQLLLLRARRK